MIVSFEKSVDMFVAHRKLLSVYGIFFFSIWINYFELCKNYKPNFLHMNYNPNGGIKETQNTPSPLQDFLSEATMEEKRQISLFFAPATASSLKFFKWKIRSLRIVKM